MSARCGFVTPPPATVFNVKDPYGAIGDGVVDDTAAIQRAIDAAAAGGGVVFFPPGTYKITSTLTVPSNVTLQGAGMGLTTIYMPSANFTNTTAATYGATSVAINCSGQTGAPFTANVDITLRDFTVESQVSDGRHLYPILARNVSNLRIHHVEVTGIPAGNLITLDSVIGASAIHDCYLHDCTSSSANSVQLTGIETDNNRINSVNCKAIDIHDNTIVNLTFTGAAFPGSQNMQTDGINTGLGSAHGLTIHDNYIKNLGEGIDIFSSECTVHSNELVDCNNVGVKLIHGASRNHVFGNTIMRPGLAGLYMGSSDTGASDNNYCHDNLIHDVDAGNVWASNTPSGILLDISGAHAFKVNNNTFRDNKITGGSANMDYAIRQDDGTNNRFYGNEAESWTVAYSSVAAGTATITNAKRTLVRAGLNATEATAAGVEEIVPFDTEEVDTQGEFSSSTFTASSHRRISVEAAVYCSTGGAGENWILRIKKNGTLRTESSQWAGGAGQQFVIQDAFGVVPGDTVAVYVYQNNGARNIGGSPVGTYLTIEEVA